MVCSESVALHFLVGVACELVLLVVVALSERIPFMLA